MDHPKNMVFSRLENVNTENAVSQKISLTRPIYLNKIKMSQNTPYFSNLCTCEYQGVRNVSFSKHFPYVLNE